MGYGTIDLPVSLLGMYLQNKQVFSQQHYQFKPQTEKPKCLPTIELTASFKNRTKTLNNVVYSYNTICNENKHSVKLHVVI